MQRYYRARDMYSWGQNNENIYNIYYLEPKQKRDIHCLQKSFSPSYCCHVSCDYWDKSKLKRASCTFNNEIGKNLACSLDHPIKI